MTTHTTQNHLYRQKLTAHPRVGASRGLVQPPVRLATQQALARKRNQVPQQQLSLTQKRIRQAQSLQQDMVRREQSQRALLQHLGKVAHAQVKQSTTGSSSHSLLRSAHLTALRKIVRRAGAHHAKTLGYVMIIGMSLYV